MSFWTSIRDTFESVAVVVGNYYVPGSSVITSNLASKGSQEQLSSDIGKLAQVVSTVYGATNGPLFSSQDPAPISEGSWTSIGGGDAVVTAPMSGAPIYEASTSAGFFDTAWNGAKSAASSISSFTQPLSLLAGASGTSGFAGLNFSASLADLPSVFGAYPTAAQYAAVPSGGGGARPVAQAATQEQGGGTMVYVAIGAALLLLVVVLKK